MSPRDTVTAAAENAILRGLAHIMAVLSPLAVAGIAAVLWTQDGDLDDLQTRAAVIDGQIVQHERAIAANTAQIGALVLRLGNNDSAQARIEAELSGVRQSLSRVEEMLAIIVRERRSELDGRPR